MKEDLRKKILNDISAYHAFKTLVETQAEKDAIQKAIQALNDILAKI